MEVIMKVVLNNTIKNQELFSTLFKEVETFIFEMESIYKEEEFKQNKQNYKKSKIQLLINSIKQLLQQGDKILREKPASKEDTKLKYNKLQNIKTQLFALLSLLEIEIQKTHERDTEKEQVKKKTLPKEKLNELLFEKQNSR